VFDDLEVDLPPLADPVRPDRRQPDGLRGRGHDGVEHGISSTPYVRCFVAYRRNEEALFFKGRKVAAHLDQTTGWQPTRSGSPAPETNFLIGRTTDI
jgi:hypothetical protein